MFDKKEIRSVFFLGGYDLEMQTIKNVLESVYACYVDHKLRWEEACLSRYEEDIRLLNLQKSKCEIYGIELREDIPLPLNYICIDHHNQYTHLPSALEQVMQLFGLVPDRRTRLIAANDKFYIPGMLELGATDEEIAEIRLADRKAQGVTDEDEWLAQKAIKENLERLGDLIIVHAFGNRFSPICDRLYPYSRLLVYTDEEWMYYGEEASKIKNLFVGEFTKGKMFNGGGVNGYVGTVRRSFSRNEILEMVEQIKIQYYGA